MMKAHHVVDAMLAAEGDPVSPWQLGYSGADWVLIRDLARRAVNIDVSRVTYDAHADGFKVDNTLVSFALELFMADLFALPFPVCFFCPPRSEYDGLLADWLEGHLRVTAICPRLGNKYTVPYAVSHVSPDNSKLLVTTRILSPKANRPFERHYGKTDAAIHEFGTTIINYVMGSTVLMSSRSADKESIEPSAELNKSRAKKGRARVNTTIVVSLSAASKKIIGTSTARSSPVPHWRRGHLRKMPSGVLVPVSPTIVGMRADEQHPLPKNYAFKA